VPDMGLVARGTPICSSVLRADRGDCSTILMISIFSDAGYLVIPPFLGDLDCRIHAAVFCFNFWTGAIPPSPMLGRSLL
jgi:hypothetical protein